MLESVDGQTIAAEVRMARMDKRQVSFVIVEGLNDYKVMSRFVDPDRCMLINATRKKNAIEALDVLENDGVVGVCAIVDQDYDVILDTKHDYENLIMTEYHDLDVVIFQSSALDSLLAIYADSVKL